MFCLCFSFFSSFFQTNYLNIYWTGLHQIRRVARPMAVDERHVVRFSVPQKTLPWKLVTNLLLVLLILI